ncbi:hypothetical protein AMATHDRAFT_2680 [Amanita thiersii Skay4041]|uniref:Ion transport domain-containing protein n=1 Tax=Amanita thiersii Skay4041 TaxID=703135 RepID=A0A2A9NLA8_9AGAR|nr:hypothetical protein AMATHDRAFT_2680 [Amanita thiersii Skay4041]
MADFRSERQPLLQSSDVEDTPVYPVITTIRSDAMVGSPKYTMTNFRVLYIDTPLSYEALTAPDLTYTVIRPLVDKYAAMQNSGNMSIVFCCLLNRVHFLRDDNLMTASVSRTRALLCEILAIQLFKSYGNDVLQLARVLTTTWPVYSGADPSLLARAQEERDDELDDRVGNAIEMAILGKAKRFIKSSACQKVINNIWSGRCVYQAESSHSILSDTYKRTPVHFYDPHKAPLLDHYRLKVPSIRSVLEYSNFLLLFLFFVIALEYSERDRLNPPEVIFMVYALGFTLEKVAAMQEHGIKVYFKGTWNGFDLAFVTTYCIYASLRLYGVYHPHGRWARSLGIDFLALIACLMFPRLAFVTLKNNLMVLSLRAMIVQFLFLMLIAAFCFCGFLYALWTLSRNKAGLVYVVFQIALTNVLISYGPGTIAWWMLDLWFGLDASGFDRATQFHPIFGPVLMVTYACLSNTLLLTVLVSILSNTFAHISEDAAAEAMFRRAVSTIEGVKADFLFSYQPPINLLALCVLLPASYVLTPRWFHKVNVFMIRLTNFPFLLMIAFYERQSKMAGTASFSETLGVFTERILDALPRSLKRLTFFEGLVGSDSDIDAVVVVFVYASPLTNAKTYQIFEIAELQESLEAHNNMGPNLQRPRRMSAVSAVRPTRTHSPPMGPHALPRMRVNSIRPSDPQAAQISSPIAQLYQPLFVDEEILEESDEDQDTTSAPTVLSHGPLTRRRLSSIQLMGPRKNGPDPSVSGKRFPVMGEGGRLSPIDKDLISESPEPARIFESGQAETKQTENLSNDMIKRLEEIEKRQQGMEQLLKHIAESLSKPR